MPLLVYKEQQWNFMMEMTLIFAGFDMWMSKKSLNQYFTVFGHKKTLKFC